MRALATDGCGACLTQRGTGGYSVSGFTHYPHHLILNSVVRDAKKRVFVPDLYLITRATTPLTRPLRTTVYATSTMDLYATSDPGARPPLSVCRAPAPHDALAPRPTLVEPHTSTHIMHTNFPWLCTCGARAPPRPTPHAAAPRHAPCGAASTASTGARASGSPARRFAVENVARVFAEDAPVRRVPRPP